LYKRTAVAPQPKPHGFRWWEETVPNGIAETVLVHSSERSALREIKQRNLVPKWVGARSRFATCSGVAWFRGYHLAVVNIYGDHLRIYRLEMDAEGVPLRLKLLHELSEGLHRPEYVAATLDGSMLAIGHSGSHAHGVSLHAIDAASFAPQLASAMLRTGPLTHALSFSPDARHLVFTDIGEPGFVEVVRVDTGASTCMLHNTRAPLKPKGAAFSADGRFVALAFAANVQAEETAPPSGGILALHRFDAERGVVDPEPVAQWDGTDRGIGMFESCAFVPRPAGQPWRIIGADQDNDVVLAFDFDPQQTTLKFAGVFATGLFPHGVDASADGRFVAIANYGDDTLRIVRGDA
jgi:hypothetical protein